MAELWFFQEARGVRGYSCKFLNFSRSASELDPRRCFGCGICRSVCKQNAIELKARAGVPIAAKLW